MSKNKLLLHMAQGQYKGRKEGNFLVVRDINGNEVERMPLKGKAKEAVVVAPPVVVKPTTSWASALSVEEARRNNVLKGRGYATYRPRKAKQKSLVKRITEWLQQ